MSHVPGLCTASGSEQKDTDPPFCSSETDNSQGAVIVMRLTKEQDRVAGRQENGKRARSAVRGWEGLSETVASKVTLEDSTARVNAQSCVCHQSWPGVGGGGSARGLKSSCGAL